MSSFAGSLTALFIAGMVGGYAGLCLLGPTDETQTMAVAAAAPIPDPPALPCSMQAWPNADRKCLDWTAPRAEVAQARAEAKTDGAQKAVATAPAPDKRATTAAQPSMVGANVAATQSAVEAAAVPAAPAARADAPAKAAAAKSRNAAHANKTKALAVMRGFGDNLNDVRLNAYAPDGSSRRSATRSAQDKSYGARPGGWWW